MTLLWSATSGSTRQAFRGVGWALIALAATGPAFYPWYLAWGLFATAVGSGPRGRFALAGLSVGEPASRRRSAKDGSSFAVWLVLLRRHPVVLVVDRPRPSGAPKRRREALSPTRGAPHVIPVWM